MVTAMIRFRGIFSFLPALIFILVGHQRAWAQSPAIRPAKLAAEHNWSDTPSEVMAQPGGKTVNLPSCPPGVSGNEPEYWVLIDGSKENSSADREAVKVTGGTYA